MKKVILTIAAVLLVALGCFVLIKNGQKPVEPKLIVENLISLDREDMYANYGEYDYRWYESCVVLDKFLDEENDGKVTEVTNVFQVVIDLDSTTYDVFVVQYRHTLEGDTVEKKEGFWVEDRPLNKEPISVTYEQAFGLVMQSNFVKPHSQHAVLRKEVGRYDCNPQYIFGDLEYDLYVDAVTGAVSDKSPAFYQDTIVIEKPLGEWP